MKVALVYPEAYEIAKFGAKRKEFPPFGVMYLASMISHAGHDVKLFKISKEQTEFDFGDFEIVGFSTPSSVTYPLVKDCRFASCYKDEALIVLGGVHASIFPIQTLVDLQGDILCIGEGDFTILEIIDQYVSRSFEQIKGICYFLNGHPVLTPPRPLIKDIDSIPFPSRYLMDYDDLILNNRLSKTNLRMTHVMFSRGCPYSCHFCAAPQKTVQFRSGKSVREELILLKKEYDIEGFSVVDDNSIINKHRVSEICQSISDLGLKWITLSRVDTVDRNTLEQMREAGCIEIAFGVESGSETILNSMNKRISKEQVKTAIMLAHATGISVKVFLIHGFPGENLETTSETLDLLQDIRPMIHRVSLFRFVPLPGSYVYKNRIKFRLNIKDDVSEYSSIDWSKYHIHHNHYHWWGTADDFEVMNAAYQRLETYVEKNWPSRYKLDY